MVHSFYATVIGDLVFILQPVPHFHDNTVYEKCIIKIVCIGIFSF